MARTRKARDPADDAVGSRLRALRTERKMSQEALAEAAAVQSVVVSRAERGVALPSLGTLRALAGALDVQVSVLLDVESSPEDRPSEDELLDAWRKLDPADQRAVVHVVCATTTIPAHSDN